MLASSLELSIFAFHAETSQVCKIDLGKELVCDRKHLGNVIPAVGLPWCYLPWECYLPWYV